MNITFADYHFKLKFQDEFRYPTFLGSTIRGGFGRVFRNLTCLTKERNCLDCILLESCPYAYIFETGVRESGKKYNAPHPFIFNIPDIKKDIKKGETMDFSLILIGNGIQYFPYFVFSIAYLCTKGLGRESSKFTISHIKKDNKVIYKDKKLEKGWDKPEKIDLNYVNTDAITINFISPTKLIHNGKLIRTPDFYVLIKAITRRLKLLQNYHNIGYEKDNSPLLETSKNIKVVNYYFENIELKRFSTRQKRKIKYDAFKGRVTFKGNITPFMELLKIGEIIHIGKATSFGFGRYKLKRE